MRYSGRKTKYGILAACMLGACAVIFSGCGSRSVTRLEPEEAMDLSGRWNDGDSRRVSQSMIEQILSGRWISRHREKTGRDPVVIVGEVRNLTLEHINPGTFTKDLEQALINSGTVGVVASAGERQELRQEREDARKWASLRRNREVAGETGADYILKGVMSSILDEEGGRRIVFYQVDLSLIDLEDNTIIWAGQERIRKYIRRPLFTF